ncbi:MAG: hypothetical protein SYC29_11150 [Planctomycetota bacterium]|nr:hypothetical protein [Planctomycetota bacterium]
MSDPAAWRDLHWCEDLVQARTIATAIAAMEYEVRVRNVATARPVGEDEEDWGGGYVVETRAADWPDLAGVLEEIIDEQREFDAALEAWHGRMGRLHRIFLGVVVGLIIALAILGIIEL